MRLELLQSCGGMDFKPWAACQIPFRPLLEQLVKAASVPHSAADVAGEVVHSQAHRLIFTSRLICFSNVSTQKSVS